MASAWTLKQVDKFLGDFDLIDTEKNGTLRFREVVHALAKAGYRGGYRQTKQLFNELDMNDDKVISRDEFKNAVKNIPPKEIKCMSLRSEFEKIDVDKSGCLTRTEIMDALQVIELGFESDKISNLLIGLVRDDDQRLNYEEFIALYNQSD